MSSCATPFLAVGAAVLWATAGAQSPSTADIKNLSIPAEPLANALNHLAQQSGLQVMFASELVARLRSPEVKGSLTAAEALQRLLSNTELALRVREPTHHHHRRREGPGGEASGPACRAQAAHRERRPRYSNRRCAGQSRR